MKKQLLENALNKPIVLKLKFKLNDGRVSLSGYLVKDEHNSKCYKILPLNYSEYINEQIIVFPPNYVKEYRFLENNYLVK